MLTTPTSESRLLHLNHDYHYYYYYHYSYTAPAILLYYNTTTLLARCPSVGRGPVYRHLRYRQ